MEGGPGGSKNRSLELTREVYKERNSLIQRLKALTQKVRLKASALHSYIVHVLGYKTVCDSVTRVKAKAKAVRHFKVNLVL